MPERKPIVEEDGMPPGEAIAVEERTASDTPTREAATHSAKAMPTKTVSTSKTMSTKSSVAATAPVSPAR